MQSKNFKIKFGILFGSLIFFLVILELGLRFGGYIYLNKLLMNTKEKIESRHGQTHTILAVGDSYTVGGEGLWKDNYPSQLQKILSGKYPDQFVVVNGGICESNSTQTLRYLTKLLKEYKVDTVILLVGATNRFNLAGFPHNKIVGFVSQMRVYKLAKIFMINLRARITQNNATKQFQLKHGLAVDKEGDYRSDDLEDCNTLEMKRSRSVVGSHDYMKLSFRLGECLISQNEYQQAKRLYQKMIDDKQDVEFAYKGLRAVYDGQEQYQKTELLFKGLIKNHADQAWPYLELAKSYIDQDRDELALALYQDALKNNSNQMLVYRALGDYYVYRDQDDKALEMFKKALTLGGDTHILGEMTGIYFKKGEFSKSIEYALKSIQVEPLDLDNYFPVAKSYEFQNKYDAKYIHHFLQKMGEKYPELKENKLYNDYVALFTDERMAQKEIYRWFNEDLEKILHLCKKYNIQLIIQNYPYPYHEVNKQLESFAKKNSLVFVDQHETFSGFTDYDRYFVDSDHCTAEGHRVMAENIQTIFTKN